MAGHKLVIQYELLERRQLVYDKLGGRNLQRTHTNPTGFTGHAHTIPSIVWSKMAAYRMALIVARVYTISKI